MLTFYSGRSSWSQKSFVVSLYLEEAGALRLRTSSGQSFHTHDIVVDHYFYLSSPSMHSLFTRNASWFFINFHLFKPFGRSLFALNI